MDSTIVELFRNYSRTPGSDFVFANSAGGHLGWLVSDRYQVYSVGGSRRRYPIKKSECRPEPFETVEKLTGEDSAEIESR
jgi:hypothetical protein